MHDVVEALDLDRGGSHGDGGGLGDGGEMAWFDRGAFGEAGGLGEGAFELAEIAWPGVAFEAGDGGFGEEAGGVAGLAGDAAEELGGEHGDVFGALAEGGHLDLDDGEAAVEILAELADGGEGAEVAVGGGDDAKVGAADEEGVHPVRGTAVGAGAEQAKEGGLEGEGELADASEVEGSFMGGLEEREGAGGVAFGGARGVAGGEGLGQGRGVADDEGTFGGGAEGVEGAGDELLAGAGFATEQRGAEVGRDALHLGAEAAHGEAFAKELRRGGFDDAGAGGFGAWVSNSEG